MEEWLCDSNEALNLSLVRAERDAKLLTRKDASLIEPFNPSFTYPIFGEQEKIFGYTDLDIQLQFASGSLKQFLHVSYSAKIDSKDTPADDVAATLYKFIPPDYTSSPDAFAATVEEETFTPLGKLIGSYPRLVAGKGKGKKKEEDPDVTFEMYHATWQTPGFRAYHRRMQLFILLFIEGGSYIQEDEDAWEFVVLYEKRAGSYHSAGYTSVYPFWCYPDQIRLRLSQFVILPPYQHQGHGSRLYSALYQLCLDRPDVAELSVEDPSEAFDVLRDVNDLRYLVSKGLPDEAQFPLGSEGWDEWALATRKKYKMAQRQFDRLLEMLLLRNGPVDKAYRLHVKARLYRFNYDTLCQMTPEERKEALARTFESVVEDYERILESAF